MKLWQTEAVDHPQIDAFTIGEDPSLDRTLLPYDCRASQAHARMLAAVGLLTAPEAEALVAALDEILAQQADGTFVIRPEDEDGHTAIEKYLVRRLGETGEKIHLGRSRNDQVLTALRLYEKEQLLACGALIETLINGFDGLAARQGEVPLPGYTHTRKAMPSSVRLWAEGFAHALRDDLHMLQQLLPLIDRNPLGTGAGYGLPLPLDRDRTTRELGFAAVMENPIHAHNSRGKLEGWLLATLSFTLADLNRMASDLILFTMPGIGYFSLPDAFCTGSSIMPQKKNPDVLELLRAAYHDLTACEQQVRAIPINLITGYHRDLQRTKAPLMRGLALARESLAIAVEVARHLTADEAVCRAAMTPELYATEKACRLAAQGLPFRQAYRQVAEEFRRRNAHD